MRRPGNINWAILLNWKLFPLIHQNVTKIPILQVMHISDDYFIYTEIKIIQKVVCIRVTMILLICIIVIFCPEYFTCTTML